MKKIYAAFPLACCLASPVWAAELIEKQVTVTATVPTAAFFVEPIGGNWMNDPQDLAYNSFTKTFVPIRKQLQAKNTAAGGINAKLMRPAVIVSGADQIPLTVSVGGKDLNHTTAQLVVNQADAQAGNGAVVDFQIASALAAGTAPKPGNYQGEVNMMFEPGPIIPSR